MATTDPWGAKSGPDDIWAQFATIRPEQLALLDPKKFAHYQQLVAGLREEQDKTRIYRMFPDEGPLRRELYVKHMEYFEAGYRHSERAFIAANRVGKTQAISYEATLHLICEYPPWWKGRRFNRPITCWAAGEDTKAVRESLQAGLLGPPDSEGTGLIPGAKILRTTSRAGIPDAVDFVEVQSKFGVSRLVFKAYEQGRESFQAAKVDVVLLDEEPPLTIYTECLTRTMATVPGEANGLVMAAFTPLKGLSATVLLYMPGGVIPSTEDQRKKAWGW